MIIATHRVDLKHVPVSLLFCFICLENFSSWAHTTAGFDPHTAAFNRCVCVRKNCIEYYDEGKIFLFNLFSLSLLFAEKPKSGEKILVFLSQHTKLFALILHFLSRHNPFLSCFRTHFPNPVRKTFFSHWLSPLSKGNAKRKFLHGFKYGPGRKSTALNWTVRKLVADWLASDEGERRESGRFSSRKEILATLLSGTNTRNRQFSTVRETRKQPKGC